VRLRATIGRKVLAKLVDAMKSLEADDVTLEFAEEREPVCFRMVPRNGAGDAFGVFMCMALDEDRQSLGEREMRRQAGVVQYDER